MITFFKCSVVLFEILAARAKHVLAILIYQSSGCAHSFPPSNKVGFSVIYSLWTVFRKLTKENAHGLRE